MKKRNIGLDFARVAAMATVWISHSSVFSLGFKPQFMEFAPIVGLEIFFALSGFLVGKSLIATVTSTHTGTSMKNFYINRFIRTIPFYYLTLLLMYIFTGVPIPLSNFFFLQNFGPYDLNFFPPSWSLPIEAWFYFLIPPIFLLLYKAFSRKHSKEKAIYLSCAVLCIVPLFLRTVHILINDPQWDYGVRKRIFLRMDALMFGVFFAAIKLFNPEKYTAITKNPFTLPISIGSILGLYGWYFVYLAEGDTFNHSPTGKILIFTFLPVFSCLLITCLENAAFFEKLRNTIWEKVICGISTVGYGVYLLHFVVFLSISPYFVGARFSVSWLGFLLAIAASIAVSFVSYWVIEIPLTKLKDKLIAKTRD